MKPTQLFIIGNGFDLWHGIPSSYGSFKTYAKLRDRLLFQSVEEYLPAGKEWNELESALAGVDVVNIIDDLGQFMPSYGDEDWTDAGHGDFQYEVQQLVERLSIQLRAVFGQWVRTLPVPTPATATKRLQGIDLDAAFLTFNYTATLEDLYGVPNAHVLHIHGQAKDLDKDLVLGHAWNPAERSSLNDVPDIEDMDTRLMEANDILDGYFSEMFKPSDELIREHHAFFEGLDKIEVVRVLGHSLSDVDYPYFKALLKTPSIANAHWWVACRSESEHQSKVARLAEFGLDARQVSTGPWPTSP